MMAQYNIIAVVVLSSLVYSCAPSIEGQWRCDRSGIFNFLDTERQPDTIALAEYYSQMSIDPIEINFGDSEQCSIQSYEGRKQDCTYETAYQGDDMKILIDRDTMYIDEILVSIDSIYDNTMNVQLDFWGENISINTTLNKIMR